MNDELGKMNKDMAWSDWKPHVWKCKCGSTKFKTRFVNSLPWKWQISCTKCDLLVMDSKIWNLFRSMIQKRKEDKS